MGSKQNNAKSGHLFSVEILLDELSNGLALEKLLQTLNSSEVIKDYKIVSGIELGKLIELNQDKEQQFQPIAEPIRAVSVKPKIVSKTIAPKPNYTPSPSSNSWINQVDQMKNDNTLVRVIILQAKGLKFDIPCRIIHYSPEEQTLTVYHVDEKKVFTYKFNEIEDIYIT